MTDKKRSTRLGNILISKGLLSPQQLHIAVREQLKLRQQLDPLDVKSYDVTSLGEILIELGFIDRSQLNSCLKRQWVLRKVAIAMALCAPLMTLSFGTIAASSSASSKPASNPLPFTIQAESFTSMAGIQTEPTTDTGGGSGVGYIDAGDWISYAGIGVNIPTTGSYRVTYRVASPTSGGSFYLKETGGSKYNTVAVPATGGWQNWTNVESIVTFTAGVHNFGIIPTVGGFNINWFKIEAIGNSLPFTIQAENYLFVSGTQTETTSDTGGGQDVGYINAKDWMSYGNNIINAPTTGTYTVTYRVSGMGGGSFTIRETGGGTIYDTVSVPSTGSWQKWMDIRRTITLTAGPHIFSITALTAGFNINWFKLESGDLTSASSSSLSPVPITSSSASSKAASSAKSSVTATASSSSSVKSNGVSTQVAGPVGMNWIAPNKRANGDILDITEVGGYEIRYKLVTDTNFTYIAINDAWTNFYNFAWLEGNYVFQVAAFDKNGLFSDYVNVF